MTTHICIEGIACMASIGVFEWEKKIRQELLLDLQLEALVPQASRDDQLHSTVDYKQLTLLLVDLCKSQHFGLLERLAEAIAEQVFRYDTRIVALALTLNKRGALRHAEKVKVRIYRQRAQVVIGLGSNIEPEKNLKEAIARLKQEFGELAETEWLVTGAVARPKDPDFINTAVLVRTGLEEAALSRRLKHIEYEMGRARGKKDAYAPRIIDLDLVLFNDRLVDADFFARDFLQTLMAQLLPDMPEHLRFLYSHTSTRA